MATVPQEAVPCDDLQHSTCAITSRVIFGITPSHEILLNYRTSMVYSPFRGTDANTDV